MDEELIGTIEDFISRIRTDSEGWPHVWFRGEPQGDTPVLPKLYRDARHHENKLLQTFRMKAPALSDMHRMPDFGEADKWLFLAQHFGLPTRLLDWTESALIALHFSLGEGEPLVWMLNPIELNRLAGPGDANPDDQFPLTITRNKNHFGSINIHGAWESDRVGTDLPIAVLPTNIFARMSAQRSCFTVHGKLKRSLTDLVSGKTILRRYRIDPAARQRLRDDLRLLGVSHSTVFPDLDGLAKDLSEQY